MRSSLIYLLLVGVPLLALIAVVRVGERIVPPRYIGGIWTFQFDSTACAFPDEVEMTQSGIVLDLQSRKRSIGIDARLRGTQILSSSVDFSPPCDGDWRLEASIEGLEGGERLVGRWMPVGCDTCSAVGFTATKIADNQRVER